jgi:apolipoprotein D and lipocalin family protein
LRVRMTVLAAAVALIGTLAVGAPAQAAAPDTGPLRPVSAVDTGRYLGTWYEIAAIPQLFEVQCAGDVVANYAAAENQTVEVRNSCRTWFGGTSSVTGRARVENRPANSVLTVSFLRIAGHWLYFGGPNYVIIGLDPDYRWAVVGDPSRDSGFVLSRTPTLTGAELAAAKAALTSNGYDLCELKLTRQNGMGGGGTLC